MPADGACIQQALSGNTERPSGYGLHLHVPFGKLVRLGQCSYTDGTESHERVAGTECEEGVRQRSDDHVPLYQRFGTDTDSCLHHDLPGTDGSGQPTDVFLPLMLATFSSTLVAILAVCFKQRINILQRNLLLFFGGMITFVGGLALLFGMMSQQSVSLYSTLFANILLFSIICGFIISGIRKKINVYDTFIEGAKEGFQTAVTIIPYLIAVLVAIAVFRASGAMDFLIDGIRMGVAAAGLDTQFVEGLPTMLMKPLSGSGARGMMLDAMNTYGADSFIGRLCSIVQGSSDTTFYVVALYFGSVKIRNTYYTIPCSLLADLAGAVAAVAMTYLFFT